MTCWRNDGIIKMLTIVNDYGRERMITYRKLFQLLAGREISKVEFRKIVDISQSTMTKLNKNEYVSLQTLEVICNKLDCDIKDIIEFKKVE